MRNKITLLVFILLFSFNIKAQEHDTIICFSHNIIALKRQNDTIYFYNSLGELRKIINLNNKKVTPFGLPKEVQKIIYDGEIPENISISDETFPTYLYTQRYVDAGEVLCKKFLFYNKLGLKTGYREICPDDTGGADYHFEDKNLYKYNKYGLLVKKRRKIFDYNIFEYNDKGQLIKIGYREKPSQKTHYTKAFKYDKNNKLSESVILNTPYQSVDRYNYNHKGLLSEIVTSKYNKIEFEYNNNGKITKVSSVLNVKDKNIYVKKTHLTYHYDRLDRIIRIQINSLRNKDDFRYTYDKADNLIQIKRNEEIIQNYKYNDKGTLIYIENRWGEDKSYPKYEK